ncbi:MAG: hypothetical protein P9M14_05220, partial [Candidatus Alcyoniella australis]|nr:hypothetical protein [Candidatus Alcyoniella australis]
MKSGFIPAIALGVVLLLVGNAAAADDKYDYSMRAYVSCSSHIDVIWKWLEPESREVVFNTFSSLSGLMYLYDGERPANDNPVHYVQSTPVFYRWLAEDHPEIMADVHFWYDRGQWHPIGGSWVEFDAQIPSGESLVRQFLYGQRFFIDDFGAPCSTGFLPDSFGYSATLPMIMSQAGIDSFSFSKLGWNDTNDFPFHVFDWIAPSGSQVRAYLTVGQYNEYIDEAILKARMQKMQDYHPGIESVLLFLGVGDHGGGTFKPWIDRLIKLRDEQGYDIVFGPPELFFEDLLDDPEVERYSWQDELYLETHRGVYTNRARVKQHNRDAELGLETVEKLWVIASDLGAPWPRQTLDQAWRSVLFNQFHDILPGSSTEEFYSGQYEQQMGAVEQSLDELSQWGMQQLAEAVDTSFATQLGASKVYLVFNPLSFTRDALVELTQDPPLRGWQAYGPQGEPLLGQWSEEARRMLVRVTDLPPLGWKAVALVDGEITASGGVRAEG